MPCETAVAENDLVGEVAAGQDAAVAVQLAPEPLSAHLERRCIAPALPPDPSAALAILTAPQLRLPAMYECVMLDKLLKLVRDIQTPRAYVGYSAFL